MIYYGIAAIFPLLCWAFYEFWIRNNDLKQKGRITSKKWLTVIAVLPIFLLFVLRYKYVGVDTIGYVKFFEKEIRQYSFKDLLSKDLMRVEVGYRLYVKVISLFTNNYTVYFLINGIFIFGTLLRFSFKHTKNPFIFFFLFITLGTYQFIETGLRQALAMTICLWAVDFLKGRKPLKFFLLVLLAYYFHKSAAIFVIIYPLCAIKKYDWLIFVYGILAVTFFVGFSAFQSYFNELLGYNYEVEETGNGQIFLMLVMVICGYSFFMCYDKKGEEKTDAVTIHLAFMTVIFWLLRLISRTAERISFYYIFGLYSYFSQAVNYDKDKLSSLLKWLLILACLVLFIHRNSAATYLFFWQGA